MTEVHAKHILVENETHAKQLRDKILNKGKEFEEVARKHSEGPSSTDGGDIGYFGRNEMVKPFERKAFQMDKGDVSEPVKTKFGYHLIKKVDER